jgi:hypothetical protein
VGFGGAPTVANAIELRRLAQTFRARADETGQVLYAERMRQTAAELDIQAKLIDETLKVCRTFPPAYSV